MSTCADVFNGFRTITESLSEEIYRRASIPSASGIWMKGIRRGAYPVGRGLTQETFTMNNSEPTNDVPAWQAETGYTAVTNTDAHCSLSYASVTTGFNTRNYSPEKYGIEGILLCRDSLTYDHNINAMVDAYLNELTKYTSRVWSNRLQEHYISLSDKVVATSALPTTAGASLSATAGSATLPSTQATSVLTKGILEKVAQDLFYIGATQPDSNGFVDLGPDGPLFTLLIDPEMINRLLTDNPDTREDYRWADAKELLKGWGCSRRFGNFQLMPSLLLPRYNYTGGAYVRVNAFVNEAATGSGYKPVLNPDYVAAEYAAAIVFNPSVMEVEFVKPVTKAASVNFNPATWTGEWTWAQGAEKLGLSCADPTGRFGRHFAEVRWAIKPVVPETGKVILYKRCQSSVEVITCS